MYFSIFRAAMAVAIAFTMSSCKSDRTESAPQEAVHGYMIANYTITDQQTFARYMEAAGPLAARYNGKVIIYDVTATTLEGTPESVIAVAEFPSVADVERFYNSPEYTAARAFRIASTKGSVLLAQGSPSGTITAATNQPLGYMIANYTINDRTVFASYMDAAGPLAPRFNGKVIIYDENPKVLEGSPQSVIAVAEFPSAAQTQIFYNSPEYTAARRFRIQSTQGSVLLTKAIQ